MTETSVNSPNVILNIGTGKFFLHQTAESLDNLGLLAATISGLTRLPRFFNITGLNKNPKIARLRNRISSLNPRVSQVQVLPGEVLWQIATFASQSRYLAKTSKVLYFLSATTFDMGARAAIKRISTPNTVYHFRAGFGGHSVQLAKSRGIPTICDHSISHPQYDWANRRSSVAQSTGFFNLERLILSDIKLADHVLVNSEFVAETFLICGDTRELRVITPPIDRKFAIEAKVNSQNQRTGIIFVGKCDLRKGIDFLTEVITGLPLDIPVRVVGTWTPGTMIYRRKLESFPNVQILPYMGYREIAKLMRSSAIFLFPSRAEGSARVVGEAMHAGCVPFITKESGLNIDPDAGFLINGMNLTELTQAILRVLKDRKLQMEYSSSARHFINRLDDLYLPELLNLYADTLGKKGRQ